jgi:hypothetical protein
MELRKAFRELDLSCGSLIDYLWSMNSYNDRNISKVRLLRALVTPYRVPALF